MKTSSIQNSILGLLVIGMIGCVPTQTTAQQPATPDPIAVAQQYIQVLNTGNLDRALAFYADDAIVHTRWGFSSAKRRSPSGWPPKTNPPA